MSRIAKRRNCSRACKLALAVLIVFSMLWVMGNRQNPQLVSQEGWHELGTGTAAGQMHPYPAMHEVEVEPLDKSPLEVLARYLPPPVGDCGSNEIEGEYDPATGTIRICGDLVRLQATLPPQLQGEFRRTLRHEYGHAYLADYAKASGIDPFAPSYLATYESKDGLDPEAFPRDLQPTVEAYLNASKCVYGMPYFTSSFQEFFAESYARYLDGDPIPGEMRAFFAAGVEHPDDVASK